MVVSKTTHNHGTTKAFSPSAHIQKKQAKKQEASPNTQHHNGKELINIFQSQKTPQQSKFRRG